MELDSGDHALIQIMDAALAEAVRKSGAWLVCKVGCTQCCHGPFAISQLDARRLRRGLAEIESRDMERGARIRQRARESIARLAPGFPGDASTGVLAANDEADDPFGDSADDEPCPALDPETGACELYAARPITCRAFGPPVRCGSDAVGVCELCFVGASDEEIAACEVEPEIEDLETALLAELERTTAARGQTIVAFALVS